MLRWWWLVILSVICWKRKTSLPNIKIVKVLPFLLIRVLTLNLLSAIDNRWEFLCFVLDGYELTLKRSNIFMFCFLCKNKSDRLPQAWQYNEILLRLLMDQKSVMTKSKMNWMLNGIHFSKWPDHWFNWKNELVSKISGMPAVWQFFIYNLQLSRGEICVANIIPPCEWGESG